MSNSYFDQYALEIESIRRKPRVLDSAPPKLTLTKVKNPVICGYAESFKSLYNSLIGTENVELFSIEIHGTKVVHCDESVYYVLKCLLMSNVCYSLEFSKACTDTFTKIVLSSETHVTNGRMYETLKSLKTETYEQKVLVDTILELVYSETATMLEWNEIVRSTNLYPKLRNAGVEWITEHNISPRELHAELKASYKDSKGDKKFCSQIVSGIPNKEFIGALYKLHENHPEIMEVVSVDDGFMEGGGT